ncbi:MAG: DUF4880 domain-containing protein [Pseudomonadota bacterium]
MEPTETGRIDSEARDWVVLLSSGEATKADAEALEKWRMQSREHELAFREAVRVWRLSGAVLEQPETRKRISRRRAIGTMVSAAGIAGSAQIASALGYIPTWRALLSDYATTTGQVALIEFNNSVSALLDGASAISVELSEKGVAVTLTQGAVLLKTKRNPDGAEYRARVNGTVVFVSSESSVELVERRDGFSIGCLSGGAKIGPDSSFALSAGEQFTQTGGQKPDIRRVSKENIAGWRNGKIVFQDTRLIDVVYDLNRHRKGRFALASNQLAERRVSGSISLTDSTQMEKTLSVGLGLRSTPGIGGFVILY